jgi:hypothetical protein
MRRSGLADQGLRPDDSASVSTPPVRTHRLRATVAHAAERHHTHRPRSAHNRRSALREWRVPRRAFETGTILLSRIVWRVVSRRIVVAALAALVVGATAIAVLLHMTASSRTVYKSPDAAVVAMCGANNILANYTPGARTNISVGWQSRGDARGDGWAALVKRVSGGYYVASCKVSGVTHG